MKTKEQQIRELLDSVFDRKIGNNELFEAAARIIGLSDGEAYPKFIWKADHFLTDEDLCEKDPEYENMMREDINRLFKEYFQSGKLDGGSD